MSWICLGNHQCCDRAVRTHSQLQVCCKIRRKASTCKILSLVNLCHQKLHWIKTLVCIRRKRRKFAWRTVRLLGMYAKDFHKTLGIPLHRILLKKRLNAHQQVYIYLPCQVSKLYRLKPLNKLYSKLLVKSQQPPKERLIEQNWNPNLLNLKYLNLLMSFENQINQSVASMDQLCKLCWHRGE
jgi:SET domain-containing protein